MFDMGNGRSRFSLRMFENVDRGGGDLQTLRTGKGDSGERTVPPVVVGQAEIKQNAATDTGCGCG